MPVSISTQVKTTDMWLMLKKGGVFVKAWNILSPGVGINWGLPAEQGTAFPAIEIPRDIGTFEIQIRLKNFGDAVLPIKLVGQTVAAADPTHHYGQVIQTGYLVAAPGAEIVHAQQFPTWEVSCYQRTWISADDANTTQAELLDFAGNSRHLTYIQITDTGGPPPPNIYTVTVYKQGEGTVSPTEGPHQYEKGATATFVATPASGWKFDHWEMDVGGASAVNPLIKTITYDGGFVKAIFTETGGPPGDTCTVEIQVSGPGTTSPAAKSYLFGKTSSITVKATPNTGATFTSWEYTITGSKQTSTVNPITLQVNQNGYVKATFTGGTGDGGGDNSWIWIVLIAAAAVALALFGKMR